MDSATLTSMTIPGVLGEAGGAVSQFGTLITLVVGLSFGFFVVAYLIRKAKAAKRG